VLRNPQDYFVSEKTDGVRQLMLVLKNGQYVLTCLATSHKPGTKQLNDYFKLNM